jgi:hypothetical protein
MSPTLDANLVVLSNVFTFYIILIGANSLVRLFLDIQGWFAARAAARNLMESLLGTQKGKE